MLFSRRGKTDGLIVCMMCGADFVSPVEWAEHDETYWWMRLRCGQCGAFREAIVSQEVADRYDRALDRTSERIAATLARRDLFDAGDFAGRRGFPGGTRER